MDIFEFGSRFNTEEKCRAFLKQEREKKGITCKSCSSTDHFYLVNKKQWQCRSCNYRTTLTSGTVMENSNLPFHYWMFCIELMTLSKKSFSALEMQRMLGHKRYEPIWLMMHKIRRVMSKRDEKYKLNGCIEFDEGFFERVDNRDVIDSLVKQDTGETTPNKRGRGSERQAKVLVMVESEPSLKAPKKGKIVTKNEYQAIVAKKMKEFRDNRRGRR